MALHQAAQVVGAVRAAVAAPEPNWAHLGLRVLPEGLTTGVLATTGELVLDFRTLTILYKPTNQDQVGFALAQHSQISLADAVENTLNKWQASFGLALRSLATRMAFAFLAASFRSLTKSFMQGGSCAGGNCAAAGPAATGNRTVAMHNARRKFMAFFLLVPVQYTKVSTRALITSCRMRREGGGEANLPLPACR